MKIIKLFLIFLISLTSNLSFSQNNLIDTLNYEIIYNYQYQINVEDSLNIQTERMVLKIGYNLSEYSSFNRTLINEKLKEMSLSGNVDMRNVPKAKILYKVVKDYKNNEMLFFNSFGTTKLFFSEPLNQISWTLINEEKEILGYKCKKAIANFLGREYTAWYSIDISLSDGPYKFHGLPGLVFNIKDTNNHHLFEAIGLKKISEPYKLDYDKHIQVTKNEYLQTVKKIKEKPSLMAQTDLMQFPKEMLDKIDAKGKLKFKYENNPIELKD